LLKLNYRRWGRKLGETMSETIPVRGKKGDWKSAETIREKFGVASETSKVCGQIRTKDRKEQKQRSKGVGGPTRCSPAGNVSEKNPLGKGGGGGR